MDGEEAKLKEGFPQQHVSYLFLAFQFLHNVPQQPNHTYLVHNIHIEISQELPLIYFLLKFFFRSPPKSADRYITRLRLTRKDIWCKSFVGHGKTSSIILVVRNKFQPYTIGANQYR